MTPEAAREIDRLEFEADCRAARERAFALIAERHGEERARVLRWIKNERPKERFIPKPSKIKADRKPSGFAAKLHTIGGLAYTRREWADHLGISLAALTGRVHRTGSLEAAVAMGGPRRRAPTPGVGKNFDAPKGTGGGSVAQDIPQIEFSE